MRFESAIVLCLRETFRLSVSPANVAVVKRTFGRGRQQAEKDPLWHARVIVGAPAMEADGENAGEITYRRYRAGVDWYQC